ncbi:MAG: hypothetical protein J5J00_12170 [Deltaproteobacteria bacterium]|nr:hypothetical protein [Deltaproteobacteria bacterium]
MRNFLYLTGVIAAAAPVSAAAEVVYSPLTRLHAHKFASKASGTVEELLYGTALTSIIWGVLALTLIFLFLRLLRPALYTGGTATLIVTLRFLFDRVSTPMEFFYWVVIPMSLLIMTFHLTMKIVRGMEKCRKDTEKEKTKERRPRALKVRGVDDSGTPVAGGAVGPTRAVKLNRPFG